MTENEAQQSIASRYGADAIDRVAAFVAAVVKENERQNLISRHTVEHIWQRHVLDSAQLLSFAPVAVGDWLDVGTGAGFPGAIIGLLSPVNVTLVEPRKKRAAFLSAALFTRNNVTVIASTVEKTPPRRWDVVSARAVASADALFDMTSHLADLSTRYILPRGRSVHDELEFAKRRWHGLFHVEPSITDMNSGIIVADRVQRR